VKYIGKLIVLSFLRKCSSPCGPRTLYYVKDIWRWPAAAFWNYRPTLHCICLAISRLCFMS